ncbi:hypothetical protein ACFVYJ_02235 [Pontibacter sp. JAM-7]|uniref:hypothetical protein n=1 Tax=Pontibacter sp. JAM-7 TaxID=3366581 RepID=UPI003AF6F871
MDQRTNQLTGSAAVLIIHFEEKLLPKAFALKERLEQDADLEDQDIAFLEQLFGQVQNLQSLAHNQPEIQPFAAGVVSLYQSLTQLAVNASPTPPADN